MSGYSNKLKDPRWQKLRLLVLNRERFTCQVCGSTTKTLHVHHLIYSGRDPWDAPPETLECLCEDCHEFREEFNRFVDRSVVPTKFCYVFIRFIQNISEGKIPAPAYECLGEKFNRWWLGVGVGKPKPKERKDSLPEALR